MRPVSGGLRSGSSFFVAARLLPAAVRRDSTALYAFCRRVDDLADDATDVAAARLELGRVRRALMDGDRDAEGEILDLVSRRRVPLDALIRLIDTVESDLGEVRIDDDRALMDYCYGVAGTVGVAMCAVLGADHRRALSPAVDLGTAMQLSNIARDVLEDAERGRVYLPANGVALSAEAIRVGEPSARRRAYAAAVELVERSERLYDRADQGMRYIPLPSRPAILAAARAYRALGRRVRQLGPERPGGGQ
ncbi:MAG: squalene/phytoene synthase family protein, partial [Acidobacteriota bacterium]